MKNLLLRLNPDLYKKLKDSAEENNRSINSEIITAIKSYLN